MRVRVHVPATARVPPDHDRTQQHQQRCDEQLGGRPELGRQLETEHEDYGDDHTHRRRMTDAPNEA